MMILDMLIVSYFINPTIKRMNILSLKEDVFVTFKQYFNYHYYINKLVSKLVLLTMLMTFIVSNFLNFNIKIGYFLSLKLDSCVISFPR